MLLFPYHYYDLGASPLTLLHSERPNLAVLSATEFRKIWYSKHAYVNDESQPSKAML